MLLLNDILKIACDKKYSDIYLTVGTNVLGRLDSKLHIVSNNILNQQDLSNYAKEILGDKIEDLHSKGEEYISFSVSGIGRFRANVFKQRNSIAISIKVISMDVPENKIDLPQDIYNYISNLNTGLSLIIGTSTRNNLLVSSLIQNISSNFSKYIITIESTIELLYKHNNSIVNQREIGTDTKSYITGIESAFREKPDILFIDDIPNYDVLKLLIKCCDAGIGVISNFYSGNVRSAIESLFDMESKNNLYIRHSLANVLKCIVNYKTIVDKQGQDLNLFEFMINTPNISNCIKDNNIKNIYRLIQNSSKLGMYTLDMSLIEAYKSGRVSREIFIQNISNKELAAKIILNY